MLFKRLFVETVICDSGFVLKTLRRSRSVHVLITILCEYTRVKFFLLCVLIVYLIIRFMTP